MTIPNMLLVGSTARNAGKTSFCSAFIEKWKDKYDIVGLKVTTMPGDEKKCHHGDGGCGACTSFSGSFEIVEETSNSGTKDTSMLLAAGAKKVYWIKTERNHAQTAVNSLLPTLTSDCIIVCESNVLSEFITAGVSVLIHRAGAENLKPSAESFKEKADFICDVFIPDSIDLILSKIFVSKQDEQTAISCKE